MAKQTEKFRDSIFLITREESCPLYMIGDEIKIEQSHVSASSYKPICLYLVEKLRQITSQKTSAGFFPSVLTQKKSTYDCGGCEGLIQFEFKKEKDFITLQMKLLNEAEESRRKKHLEKFFGPLRKLAFFESLDDDALIDLTLLLELKTIPLDKVVLKKDEAGTHLFIVLSGKVAVMSDTGERLAEIASGNIFGERSLLSGEPISHSIHTIEVTQVAMLSRKNFHYVMNKYPVLQIFLLKLLINRAQTMTLRSGQITSGMSGELSEIKMVDLLQLINSTGKTGMLTLTLDRGRASVAFQDGEIIKATYLDLTDKDAVFALLTVENGHFAYDKGLPPTMANLEPIGGFMGMLMEGLQRIDEG